MGEQLFVSGLVGPYRFFQRKNGHRHGIDEATTAWYALQKTAPVKKTLYLCTGIGTVGLAQWSRNDLTSRAKSDPAKLALAARLRQETTLSVKEIAGRLNLGKPKGTRTNHHKLLNNTQPPDPQSELGI